MRKIKLQMQLSLDGYVADVNGQTDWMVWNWGNDWNWDDRLKRYFNDLTASIDCVLLSRKMAEEGFIAHWAKVAGNPNDPQSTFAKAITDVHKVVFSKTFGKSRWKNTDIAKGDLASEINRLKNQQGKDMIVYGGASFVSSLIQARLIDEFHLFVNPAVLGDGIAIFKEVEKRQNLKLKHATGFDCGIAVLCYEPEGRNER